MVGSDYGALSERIETGVNGLKVPKDDVQAWASALSLLIRDSALRERMTRGVKPPESIRDMAARYSDLYRDVIAGRQLRPGIAPVSSPMLASRDAESVAPS